MNKADFDKVQNQLDRAIQKDAPCTFEDEIPVLVTVDNGVKYKGFAFEVQPKSDNFPKGLVMVRTSNSDIGVPVSYISDR